MRWGDYGFLCGSVEKLAGRQCQRNSADDELKSALAKGSACTKQPSCKRKIQLVQFICNRSTGVQAMMRALQSEFY
jgi:hypothetical protein